MGKIQEIKDIDNQLKEKQPGKLSLLFAKIYFITAIISLLIFTITGTIKIVSNGWTPGSITLAAVIGLNYIILICCMVFANNAKSAKRNYIKAKKALVIGKKFVKITNACSAVVVIATTKLINILDYINLITGILQASFAIIGLILTINRMIKKHKRKKKLEAKKAALIAATTEIRNKAMNLKNQLLGKKEEIIGIEDQDDQSDDENIIDVDILK